MDAWLKSGNIFLVKRNPPPRSFSTLSLAVVTPFSCALSPLLFCVLLPRLPKANEPFRALYSHLASFPPRCPNTPPFLRQCSSFNDFNQPRPLSTMHLYFRCPTCFVVCEPTLLCCRQRSVVSSCCVLICRMTRRGDSKMTPIYAVGKALLKHAVRNLRLGEPYVTWERYEDGKS